MHYRLVVGGSPQDLPFGTFLVFQESLDDYFESQIDMQRAAFEEALASFWNEVNS